MKKLEWKEKSKEYKIGYIIGCIIMFFLGLISCLLSFLYPISAIFLIPLILILKVIGNKRVKKKRKERKKKEGC